MALVSMRTIDWDDLQVGKRLGAGGCGEVFKGKWKDLDVAIKQLFLKKMPKDLLNEFRTETDIHN